MRRMLDPKEAGGGGGKTYIHSISIASSSYQIYINIYSNSNTQLTFSTFKELMSHYGNVICTGFYTTSTTNTNESIKRKISTFTNRMKNDLQVKLIAVLLKTLQGIIVAVFNTKRWYY